ncbi:hypothetical protein ABID56_002398 [Alkalibacillus flavidus]|uniref:Endolytic transglycosylase MltG n=1 Tax=Alkalibacillus flavidus TaxID=546021 RepID=A0ABV2KYR5_9BACI
MKPILMSFSLGILLATILIGAVYWIEADQVVEQPSETDQTDAVNDDETDDSMTEEGARSFLEDNGYAVITEDDYNDISELEAENSDLKDQINELEESEPTSHVEAFELTIESGMGLESVASQLASENIIDNDTRFREYLIENGYSRSIQIGSYVLTSNMSLQQIADTITD